MQTQATIRCGRKLASCEQACHSLMKAVHVSLSGLKVHSSGRLKGVVQRLRCALQQHYPQQQQQHSSYAAPGSHMRPAPMPAPAYPGQTGAYASAPMYPQQQQAGFGEGLCTCLPYAVLLAPKSHVT